MYVLPYWLYMYMEGKSYTKTTCMVIELDLGQMVYNWKHVNLLLAH